MKNHNNHFTLLPVLMAISTGAMLIANIIAGGQLSELAFSGNSIIIVVGVILETARELESQMIMRHYKGFLE